MMMNDWIRTAEELPEKNGYYLACNARSQRWKPIVTYYDMSAGWYSCNITHWMELPEMPEEDA